MQTNDSLAPAENGHLLALAFEGKSVRIFERDGDPWFVAKDVCDLLDIANSRDAVSRLDDDQRESVPTDTIRGRQNVTVVSESGLYQILFLSIKPEAKRFRKWVTSEVLPQIRKTGGYVGGASTALSKLENALVDLAREHDARIGDLEAHMRPGDDWLSIANWVALRNYPRLNHGRTAKLSRIATERSGAAKLPIGTEKSGRNTRRTFSPRVLDAFAPAIVERWLAKDQEGGFA